MHALQVEGLTKRYGDILAVDSVSFEVREDEIFGLLGPNGAGKTTLMEIIAGLRDPDRGDVRVFGIDALRRSKEVARLIGFNPQETFLYPTLTARENLRFVAALYGMKGSEFRRRLTELAGMLEVEDLLDRRVDKLSGGQRRRINLLASLLHSPRLLILDEPTVGLDPDARRDFWKLILHLRDSGTTILLSTHYMEEADQLCDRVAIMDSGRIVALGTPGELKSRYGGRSKVIVHFAIRDLGRAERVMEELGASNIGDAFALETDDPEAEVGRITSALVERGVQPTRVELRSPTLEDVFLNLTGRRLEEVIA